MKKISPKTQEALEKFLASLEDDFKKERLDTEAEFQHEIQDYEVTIKSSGKERYINLETDTLSTSTGFNGFDPFSLGLRKNPNKVR